MKYHPSLNWLFAFVVVAVIGCGGDDELAGTSAAPGAGATTTSGAENAPAPAPSGGGSGTLVVDGKTLEVDIFFCGFGPEETRNDDVPFSMRGSGTDDGKAFTIDGVIVTVTRDISSLSMWYDEDPLTLIYEAEVNEPDGYVISGKEVGLTAEFSGADGSSVGEGSFTGRCP